MQFDTHLPPKISFSFYFLALSLGWDEEFPHVEVTDSVEILMKNSQIHLELSLVSVRYQRRVAADLE